MEQEIHTRWAFPGAFAAGTFLWLAYVFKVPCLAQLQEQWLKVTLTVVTGAPVVGYLSGTAVYWIVGGYHGRWFFQWGRGSEARRLLALHCGRRIVLTGKPPCAQPDKIDPDVVFSLAALGARRCDAKTEMPEALRENARRRWTACWAAWNSAAGIALGALAYLVYRLHRDTSWIVLLLVLQLVVWALFWCCRKGAARPKALPTCCRPARWRLFAKVLTVGVLLVAAVVAWRDWGGDGVQTWSYALLPLAVAFVGLLLAGRGARRHVWQLERWWVALAFGDDPVQP